MKRIAIVAGTMFSVVACLGQQRQPNIVFILADDMGYPLSDIRPSCHQPSSGGNRGWVSMATLS